MVQVLEKFDVLLGKFQPNLSGTVWNSCNHGRKKKGLAWRGSYCVVVVVVVDVAVVVVVVVVVVSCLC